VARTKDKEKPVQIIDAAFSVFGETGYDATLVKDIADRAGISSGTIYTYFKDKRDLFRATVREGWKRFLGQIEEVVESDEPVEQRLERFVEMGFQILKAALPLLRGMLFESSQMNLLQGSLDEFCGLVEKLLTARVVRPAGASPAFRRSMIKVTVVGALFSAALADPAHVDEEIDSLKRMVTQMLSGGRK
jgi:TetR/AcrR family transcriptional regulator, transcriptional repressor of aconitase